MTLSPEQSRAVRAGQRVAVEVMVEPQPVRLRTPAGEPVVPLPDRDAKVFQFTTGRGIRRTPADAARQWEQACRQKWRALALAIKAKLECVESGIETFERAFMAEIVLPNGRTIGEHYLPQLAQVYKSGKVPPLMLPPPAVEGEEV